jgi:hypothetical protein
MSRGGTGGGAVVVVPLPGRCLGLAAIRPVSRVLREE